MGLLVVVTAAVSGCGEELDGKLTGELFWKPDSYGRYDSLPSEGYIRLVDVTGLPEIGGWIFREEPVRVVATGMLEAENGKGRVSFTIPYDAARIDRDSDYAIIVRYSWFWEQRPAGWRRPDIHQFRLF